jgi:hypothetical protein
MIRPQRIELCGLLPQLAGELVPVQTSVTALGVEGGEERVEIENGYGGHAALLSSRGGSTRCARPGAGKHEQRDVGMP